MTENAQLVPNRIQPEEARDADPKALHVRLTARSRSNVDKMMRITGVRNKTAIVNAAIDLATEVMQILHSGGKVTYTYPDGTSVRLKIVGVG